MTKEQVNALWDEKMLEKALTAIDDSSNITFNLKVGSNEYIQLDFSPEIEGLVKRKLNEKLDHCKEVIDTLSPEEKELFGI